MNKVYLLTFVAIISIFNNSDLYASTNANSYRSCNNINNYSIDQCNTVTQSDLDEVDRFINDFLLGKTTPTTDYYITDNDNFLNSIINNNNNTRKLSYDVIDNKYNTLTHSGNTNNKQIATSSNNNVFNNITHNSKTLTRNNTYKILQSTKKQYSNIVPINQFQNTSNQIFQYNAVENKMPNNNYIIPNTYKVLPSTNIRTIVSCNNVNDLSNTLTKSEMKSILTDSEINRLINNNIQSNTNNKIQYNNVQDSNLKKLEKILTKEEIDKLLSNSDQDYVAPNYTVPTAKTILINSEIQQKNKQTKKNNEQIKQPAFNKINNNKSLIRSNTHNFLNDTYKINEFSETKNDKNYLTIETNTNDIQYNTCLTDRNSENKNYNIIHSNDNNKKKKLSKAIIKTSNKFHKPKLLNKKVVLRQAVSISNSINTNWEHGISQDEVTLFFDNIKCSNAFENAKMQIYSLLGDIAPGFGDTDKIRLIFDIIKYNKCNKYEKHNYNYEKPLALAGVCIDYYLYNIDLYNKDIDQFNIECAESAASILSFNTNDYSYAMKILYYNSFYSVINKIVKGVNLIEEFKKNKNNKDEVNITKLNLSNGKRQDWFMTTFQLFDYALQYSNENSLINNTNFAKFDDYLKNKSKHRNINEEIQFIPTLKSFVKQNKDKFSNNNIKDALEALYSEEDNDIGCYGIMGSILMFRIFPELKTIFSSNQFGINDSIINLSNKFHFNSNQSLAKQFNDQAHQLLDIAYYDNGRQLFNNTDYLIMITNGFTRDKVINNRKYISRYNTSSIIDPNKSPKQSVNPGNKLELYELVGVQLCSIGNTNYVSIGIQELEDAINIQTPFGKLCIEKKLQPIQALYKRISQEDFNKNIV